MIRLRFLAISVEIAAWALIVWSMIWILLDWRIVTQLLTRSGRPEQIWHEQESPRDVALNLLTAIESCKSRGAVPRGAPNCLREEGSPVGGVFDAGYHCAIDPDSFGVQDFRKLSIISGREMDELSWEPTLAECISEWTCSTSWFGGRENLDSRVLWLFAVVAREGRARLVYWPDTNVPPGFDPWSQPWFPRELDKTAASVERMGAYSVYLTSMFRDPIIREQVKAISIPIELDEGTIASAVVVVQAGASAVVYSRLLLLNLVISVAIAILALLVRIGLPQYYLTAWYRAWLGVATLYSLLTLDFFGGEHLSGIGIFHGVGSIPGAVSIINNSFFLLSGLTLFWPRRVRTSGKVAFVLGLLFLTSFLALEELDSSVSQIQLSDLCEGIFTAIALGVLGLALTTVLWNCGKSLEPFRLGLSPAETSGWKIPWIEIGGSLIATFFAIYIVLQLTIPLWSFRPLLEDLFLYASVPMKVGLAAIFYGVMLVELYWERFQANNVFFKTMRQGVVGVDGGMRILFVNGPAAEMINLPPDLMRGKHLSQVLFRSLIEAESIYRRLAAGEFIENISVGGKHFVDSQQDVISDIEYRLSASHVGRGGAGRLAALFLVGPADTASAESPPS